MTEPFPYAGPAANARYGETRRRRVLGIIRSRATQGLPMLTSGDIGIILGIPHSTVRDMIRRLERDGEIKIEHRMGSHGGTYGSRQRRITLNTGERTDWSVGYQTWRDET